MLDAYVIEEIKRRDRERTRDERPAIELPLPPRDRPAGSASEPDERKEDRGVVIIDYSGG